MSELEQVLIEQAVEAIKKAYLNGYAQGVKDSSEKGAELNA